VLFINLLAALAAGLVVVWNARTRTDREMTASVGVTERFMREAVELFDGEGSDARLELWPIRGQAQRHVRVRVEHPDGRVTDLIRVGTRGEHTTPTLFSALIGAREIEREIPLIVDAKSAGRVVIVGTPSDEIAEVWEDVWDFLVIAIGVNVAILLALYFALGRVLAQLRSVAAGLGQLEQGRFVHRMEPPSGLELGVLTERFNALAEALDTARRDNAALNRKLVSTQDDERRQIAADLHDELGPCLFGLKANAGSLERQAPRTPILVFSMHADLVISSRALEAGATGYLLEDTSASDFLEAFEKVRRGLPYMSRDLATEVTFLSARGKPGTVAELTPRELQTISLLAEGKAYAQIADELGGATRPSRIPVRNRR